MDSIYQFPKRILPEDKKGEKYTLDFAKAIEYYGRSHGYNKRRDTFKENRQYGNGTQDTDKLKDLFSLERNNKTMQREGVNNLDFRVTPFAPRLVNTVITLLSQKSNRANVVFMNDIATGERVKKIAKMRTDIELTPKLNQVMQQVGIPPKKIPEDQPQDVESLNILTQLGGVKLEEEIALEKGIDYTLNYDLEWEKRIGPYVIKDLIENGITVLVDEVNPKTGMINVRLANIENIIMDGSDRYDYDGAQFFGELRDMTVLDVYNQVKKTTGREIKESDLEKVGLSRTDYHANDSFNGDWYETPVDKELEGYFPQRVKVLDFYYLSTDIIKSPKKQGKKHYIKDKNIKKKEIKSGKIKRDEKGWYKLIDAKNKKVEVDVWRKGKWVVDTDIVFDYGLAYDQVRDENFKPLKPFHAIRLNTISIIETIKTNLDALQLDMLNLQKLKANMTGYGIAVDMDALTNIKLGGKDYNPKKIFKLYKLSNVLYYKNKKAGNPLDKLSGSPITELEGGIGRAFNEIMSDIQFHVQQIQLNTGLNEVALAQNPNPETTYGQAQMAMKGATNAIEHVYDAYKMLKESVSYHIAVRLQNIANKREKTPYETIIGKTLFRSLRGKENLITHTGVKVIDTPSYEDIQMLYQNLAKLAPGTLTTYDMFLIESMVNEGKPLKAIAAIMESKIRKREEEAAKNAQAAQEANDKKQLQMIQMKQQSELQKEQLKGSKDLQKEKMKIDGQRKINEENDYREFELFGKKNMDDNY